MIFLRMSNTNFGIRTSSFSKYYWNQGIIAKQFQDIRIFWGNLQIWYFWHLVTHALCVIVKQAYVLKNNLQIKNSSFFLRVWISSIRHNCLKKADFKRCILVSWFLHEYLRRYFWKVKTVSNSLQLIYMTAHIFIIPHLFACIWNSQVVVLHHSDSRNKCIRFVWDWSQHD